ncbi:MAG: dephospho-CoA kinase, partial [Proteobacteria bacterium]
YTVVDADILAREAVQIGTQANLEISRAFGPDSILPTGDLNRARIGEVVFSDKSKLALLESIIHPEVRRLALERKAELASQGVKLAFYDVPLLFEKDMEPLFDSVVVVAAKPELQRARLILRNGFSPAEAEKRIAAQIAIAEKIKRAHFVIHNDGSVSDLEKAVDVYLTKLQ